MKIKKTPVTRKFLNDLARSIYDSKSRRFLRLCNGTLQNGPDPTNKKRPMHCGLGELYFAMTGVQPEDTGVDENDVVNLAVERSNLETTSVEDATAAIEEMSLPQHVKDELIDHLENQDDEDLQSEDERSFREALDAIPGENDDSCGNDEQCSVPDYRNRSKRVAAQLREAAKFLPK